VAGSARIPLAVGHPDHPDEMLVAVLTDDEAYVAEPSVRVRDRQVPQRLERLGWTVVQVWSAAAFLDPQAEADAIHRAVLARLAERPRASGVPAQVPVPVVGVESGEVQPSTEAVPGGGVAGPVRDAPPVAVPGDERGASVVGRGQAAGGDGPEAGVRSGDVRPGDVDSPVELGSEADVEPARTDSTETGPAPTRAVPTGPRPSVQAGLPISAYGDNELDELAAWILSDGVERDEQTLAAALRAELALTRRSARVDAAVGGAARRALG
jgi:hypothetical protein